MSKLPERWTQESEEQSATQAASYTSIHLQVRPDLRMAIGIFLKANFFKLFSCFAGRVNQTSRIKWEDNDEAREILSARMWRLYFPDVDSSIITNYRPLEIPTFTIVAEGREY
ncbi:hypothetical protein CPB86DRAFT_820994 [Serendipita vermifera]|nr:hypothetical protein CPB86DRAFT_820994 [Serendipita vermifera]